MMANMSSCNPVSMRLMKVGTAKPQSFSTTQASGETHSLVNNYENAISTLNTLQSNFSVLQDSMSRKHQDDSKHIGDTIKYLERIGIKLENLDKLSAIHVSGTKGKGSTCAMIESILRSNGYRTGFFSSPHLVSVTERIRLNGMPISTEKFSETFWRIYERLSASREHMNDLPSYFGFLTILAFDVFLREEVDVCVVEVGIGGRYDCTNALRRTATVGITSLGLEHTKLLGNTLEEIAWQKAGIIKPGSDVYTVEQPAQCMQIIEQQCAQSKAKLHIVPSRLDSYRWTQKPSLINDNCTVVELNTSLAIQIASSWMCRTHPEVKPATSPLLISQQTATGVDSCFWPGRLQRITYDSFRTLYLDGAHTVESTDVCARWFSTKSNSQHKRLLIFNTTGDRDSFKLISTLSRAVKFDAAFFAPNIAFCSESCVDATNHNFPLEQQIERCRQNYMFWVKELKNEKGFLGGSIDAVFNQIEHEYSGSEQFCDILVTGSIHLIGATLTALKLEKYAHSTTPEE
uniref:Folylpolyglutamate synthase n=1 Tax=Anopheles dirus TaxID=7168 RepID=A0A182NQB5_9DIPT